ncbi:NAD(P)H dehydrogenase (quinone) [Pseudonocardia thermophila]|uniref:NAD(P)H dehydrogenase (Quinone) n=1 Tax=Pseudonocardia thermophila TaxID=1848 RepID=A0A1M6XIH8_PSETH|nr:NAD(P)H:quinone oxidoreductase [Pseudonocardia thermophila]SHL05794.1 NAD(P)H dehydrogenase (quinone) [Pseudonocardia thermophila]
MARCARISVIYYSATGTTYEIAKEIVRGAEGSGAEVRLRRVSELAPAAAIASKPAWSEHLAATRTVPVASADDVVWADGVIIGSPTRFGNVASQLKQFLDTLGPQWAKGLLAGKVYSGFTSTDTQHGGQESTLLALYTTFYHFGGVVAAPGYTDPVKFVDGNPYGSAHVGRGHDLLESDGTSAVRAAARFQGERVARIAAAMQGL